MEQVPGEGITDGRLSANRSWERVRSRDQVLRMAWILVPDRGRIVESHRRGSQVRLERLITRQAISNGAGFREYLVRYFVLKSSSPLRHHTSVWPVGVGGCLYCRRPHVETLEANVCTETPLIITPNHVLDSSNLDSGRASFRVRAS